MTHCGRFLISFLNLMLFSMKLYIFSWQFSMLQIVSILLSVYPQSKRKYQSALAVRCSYTLSMMVVPSHSLESRMQLFTYQIISTRYIFYVEIMLRMLVFITASFSNIFWNLKSIAFCFLYSVQSSIVSKHRFYPLSPTSVSSPMMSLSHVSCSTTQMSSLLNLSFQSSSMRARKLVLASAISLMQGGQVTSRSGFGLRLRKYRQSKKLTCLKVLLIEVLNYAKMPYSIVFSNLLRKLQAISLLFSQRKKVQSGLRNPCAWKRMLSFLKGKIWQRSLIGTLSEVIAQLNSTVSSARCTVGTFRCIFLELVLPLAKVLVLRQLSPMQLNLLSSLDERATMPLIFRNQWFC